ncbi:hypothetical protein AVEN_95468-1 [Araneus ventricosus]|uniref:Uncharacterized protein n=1 Tax=Araneus ventricosus TaxID=182803 RepID=A0A4Y2JJA4_ARAVE|nr:hypothetical protein AVEN_95468-1 [Araneus ventricosus]
MGCTPVHVTPDAAMLSIPRVPEIRQSALASGRGTTHEHLSITNHLPKRHAATPPPPATGPAAQEALLDMRVSNKFGQTPSPGILSARVHVNTIPQKLK